MSERVFDRLEDLLDRHGVRYDILRHEAVYTSQQAACVRGTPLASGAKALVCKGDGRVVMFVIPADRRLDSRGIRRQRNWRKLRFLSREEVFELTGLEPGAIPRSASFSGCRRSATGDSERTSGSTSTPATIASRSA